MEKCPKCGGKIGKIALNPRSGLQTGHCGKCGKLVNLGKAKAKIPEPAKAGKAPEKPAAATPGGPLKGRAKRRAAERAKKQAAPAADSVQPTPAGPKRAAKPVRRGFGAQFRSFFDL